MWDFDCYHLGKGVHEVAAREGGMKEGGAEVGGA